MLLWLCILEPAAYFPRSSSVPYAALAEVFERIDSTTKRLEIAEYLTTFLTNVISRTPADLIKVIYLCINRVSAEYQSHLILDVFPGLRGNHADCP